MATVPELTQALKTKRSWFVLTGAGCSTGSGIPDYRDDSGEWRHAQPMTFQKFTGALKNRQRYWARSSVGFERISEAKPNAAHTSLMQLERLGYVSCLVTQNVDTLHTSAGSERVIDLHGRLDSVDCLDCGLSFPRKLYQASLSAANQSFATPNFRPAPDGDAVLEGSDYSQFRVPPCPRCEGVLKPGVVFFGESVPSARVERAYSALAASDAVLVVGSSLTVFSGFRFVKAAAKQGLPIFLVNRGVTRADSLATLRVTEDCTTALPALVRGLGAQNSE